MRPVNQQSLGESKAKCVCNFLQELNDAVEAKFVEESPEMLIETRASFFAQFTLVIATQVQISTRFLCYITLFRESKQLLPIILERRVRISIYFLNFYSNRG